MTAVENTTPSEGAQAAAPPLQSIVLIDYDNVRPRPERASGDVEATLARLRALTLAVGAKLLGGRAEVSIRLYGGWLDERGYFTQQACWVANLVEHLRGRHGQVLLKADLALTTLCRPRDRLVGTMRSSAEGVRQKMVDTMLAVDAIHALKDRAVHVVLMTDDDDLVPAAMLAHGDLSAARPLHWIRKRAAGRGLNDKVLVGLHVNFIEEGTA